VSFFHEIDNGKRGKAPFTIFFCQQYSYFVRIAHLFFGYFLTFPQGGCILGSIVARQVELMSAVTEIFQFLVAEADIVGDLVDDGNFYFLDQFPAVEAQAFQGLLEYIDDIGV
jgi:hypothetical protein